MSPSINSTLAFSAASSRAMFMATVVFPVEPCGLVTAITTGDELVLGETLEVIELVIRSSI
jgi:hypothetical protein